MFVCRPDFPQTTVIKSNDRQGKNINTSHPEMRAKILNL